MRLCKKLLSVVMTVAILGSLGLTVEAAGASSDAQKPSTNISTNGSNIDPYYWYMWNTYGYPGSSGYYEDGYQSNDVYVENKDTYKWYEYPSTAGKNANKRFCLHNGKRVTGFAVIGGKTYCFDSNGFMLKSCFIWHGGNRYYLSKNGNALEGWYDINDYRYYFKEGGAAVTGVVSINDTIYLFDAKGRLVKGKNQFYTYKKNVYYVNKSGKVATGWKKLKNKYYYFYEDGVLARDELVEIDGKYCSFDAKGVYQGIVSEVD